MTVERFVISVQERARLTDASLGDAFRSLLVSLSDENLGRIEEELTKRDAKGLDQDNEQSHGRTECLWGLAPDYRVLS
jgi:hypothetical protein